MRRALSVLLILTTSALFYNNVANWHFHELPNGIVIEHAHPYKKAPVNKDFPSQNHKHSDIEYLILDLVYHVSLIILLLISGALLFRLYESIYSICISKGFIPQSLYCVPLLRAPPSI